MSYSTLYIQFSQYYCRKLPLLRYDPTPQKPKRRTKPSDSVSPRYAERIYHAMHGHIAPGYITL